MVITLAVDTDLGPLAYQAVYHSACRPYDPNSKTQLRDEELAWCTIFWPFASGVFEAFQQFVADFCRPNWPLSAAASASAALNPTLYSGITATNASAAVTLQLQRRLYLCRLLVQPVVAGSERPCHRPGAGMLRVEPARTQPPRSSARRVHVRTGTVPNRLDEVLAADRDRPSDVREGGKRGRLSAFTNISLTTRKTHDQRRHRPLSHRWWCRASPVAFGSPSSSQRSKQARTALGSEVRGCCAWSSVTLQAVGTDSNRR